MDNKRIPLGGQQIEEAEILSDTEQLENRPAFPFVMVQQHPVTGAMHQVAEPGITMLDYHLASAPDMPTWWPAEYRKENPAADEMDLLIGWRYNYAINVMLQRSNYMAPAAAPGKQSGIIT